MKSASVPHCCSSTYPRLPKLRCYTVSFGLRLFFPNQSNPTMVFKVDEKDTSRASFEIAPEVWRDSGLLSSMI
jgi:hypothetical protein